MATGACSNCGTTRFPPKGRLCSRCAYCALKLRRLKSASPDNPRSLQGVIPKGGFSAPDGFPDDPELVHGYGPGYWAEQFNIDRNRLIREYEERLVYLQSQEERIDGRQVPTVLEVLQTYKEIARWCGVPKKSCCLSECNTTLPSHLPRNKDALSSSGLLRFKNERAEGGSRFTDNGLDETHQ